MRTGRTLGRYRLDALLGRGGMAEVYAATDGKLGRTVAIKVIQPSHVGDEGFLARFLQEARLVAALEHPHILPIYDYGEEDGIPYLVMPHIAGGTLRQRMVGSPTPVDRALGWIVALGEALDAAHAAGVLHRDVKPANVLLGKDERLFLSDFGIAKMLESSARLTATGVVVGTPIYMAPEQAQGKPATPASDRYALGVLAYELLAGRPPFEGESALALLHQHVTTPAPALSTRVAGFPVAADGVFERILAKDPAARPASGRALGEALARALGGATGPTAVLPSAREPAPVSPTAPTELVPAPTAVTEAAGVEPTPSREIATPNPTLATAGVAPARGRARLAVWVAAAAAVLAGVAYMAFRAPAPGAGASLRPVPTAVQASAAPRAVAPSPGGEPAKEPASPTMPPVIVREIGPAPTTAPPSRDAEKRQLDLALAEARKAVEESRQELERLRRDGGPGHPPVPPPPPRAGEPPVSSGEVSLAAARARLDATGRRLSRADFEAARAAVEGVLEDDPGRADARAIELYAKGGLAYLARRDDEAVALLLEAVRISRGALGADGAALALLSRLVESGLGPPKPWEVALAFGDARADAKALLDRALAAHPDDARALYGAAHLYRLDGRPAESAAAAGRAYETAAVPFLKAAAALFLANAHAERREGTEAVRWLRAAVTPRSTATGAAALRAAKICAEELGLPDEAAEFLRLACDAGKREACRELRSTGAPALFRDRPRRRAKG